MTSQDREIMGLLAIAFLAIAVITLLAFLFPVPWPGV